jgi:hypothetical protein
VLKNVEKLQATELVDYEEDGNGKLASTEYGDIMSRVRFTSHTLDFCSPLLALHSTIYGKYCTQVGCSLLTPLLDESDTQAPSPCKSTGNCVNSFIHAHDDIYRPIPSSRRFASRKSLSTPSNPIHQTDNGP